MPGFLYDEFVRKTARELVPFFQIAAKSIRVKGEFYQTNIHRAWDSLWSRWGSDFNFWENSPKRDNILLVALIARAIPENFGDAEESPGWLVEKKKDMDAIAMSDEEIEAWSQSPAVKELVSVATDRNQAVEAIIKFDTNERKVFFGEEYRGISLFVEHAMHYNWSIPTSEEAEELAKIGRHYIDAAYSLNPQFRAAGLNARYAKRNLPSLVREYAKYGRLLRVFKPFALVDGSPEMELRQRWGYRGPVEGEPKYPCTPEVQFLLWACPPEKNLE